MYRFKNLNFRINNLSCERHYLCKCHRLNILNTTFLAHILMFILNVLFKYSFAFVESWFSIINYKMIFRNQSHTFLKLFHIYGIRNKAPLSYCIRFKCLRIKLQKMDISRLKKIIFVVNMGVAQGKDGLFDAFVIGR